MHASRIAAAQQMFRAQQFTGVASLCADALEGEPDNLDLRVLRVRALLALRRDEEARVELSRILRSHRETAEVFQLLGELAIRRKKLDAAETFLKQALRLAPHDRKVSALLELVRSSNQPTVAVEKLPAATATVGCTLALPEEDDAVRVPHRGTPGLSEIRPSDGGSLGGPRFALGTARPPTSPTELFGMYLVDIGALTLSQLRAALEYHRRAGVRVGTAAVVLGFLSEPSVEGAARAFHGIRQSA